MFGYRKISEINLYILLYGIFAFFILTPIASTVIWAMDLTLRLMFLGLFRPKWLLMKGSSLCALLHGSTTAGGIRFFNIMEISPYTIGAYLYKYLTPSNPYIPFKILIWIALVVSAFFTYKLSLFLTKSEPAAFLAEQFI